ncbi:hypothetical protein JCM6882_001729 [Rhodosporidiobolus microsporus]
MSSTRSTASALIAARWNRLRGREGCIRLLDEDEKEGEGALPFFLSAKEAEEEGYTSAHLLFECVLASLWNASCLFYLTHPSSFFLSPPSSPPASPPPAPSRTFIYALLALVAVPLFIGVSAGAAALWGQSRVDVLRREKSGWVRGAATWVAFVGCAAAVYPILFHILEGQNPLLKGHLTVSTALIQAVLVKAGSEALSATDEDISDADDDQDCVEKKTAFFLPPSYSALKFEVENEKTLLTAREVLLEERFSGASAKARKVLGIEAEEELTEVEVEVEEKETERLQIHSFAV